MESLSDSTSGTDIKLDLVVQEDTLVHAMCNHQLRATQPAWWARQHVQEVQNDGDSCETIELKPASLDISLVEINGDFSSFSGLGELPFHLIHRDFSFYSRLSCPSFREIGFEIQQIS